METSSLIIQAFRKRLTINYEKLVNNLDTREHLDYLIQEEIIELEDSEIIQAEVTEKGKNRKLLQKLLTSHDPGVVKTFRESLKRIKTQTHLLKVLEDLEKDINLLEHDEKEEEKTRQLIEEFLKGNCEKTKQSMVVVADLREKIEKYLKSKDVNSEIHSSELIATVKRVFTGVDCELVETTSLDAVTKDRKARKKKVFRNLGYLKLEGKSDNPLTNDDSITSMFSWSPKYVGEWINSLFPNEENNLGNYFEKEDVDGQLLTNITRTQIKEICPSISWGKSQKIVDRRDEWKTVNPHVKNIANVVEKENTKPRSPLKEIFRSFDKSCKGSFRYNENAKFPLPQSSLGNLIEPIHKYVMINAEHQSVEDMSFFILKEVTAFASACLNDRSNATIHFGVIDEYTENQDLGTIKGIQWTEHEHNELCQYLNKSYQICFSKEQVDIITRCIRAPQMVPVIPQMPKNNNLFVLEIDILPSYDICEEEVFFVRPPLTQLEGDFQLDKKTLFRFNEGKAQKLHEDGVHLFMQSARKIACNRKQAEGVHMTNNAKKHSNQKKKLENLISLGEGHLEGDIYPILVINRLDNSLSKEEIHSNMSFLKNMDWKVVLDFDTDQSKTSIYSYLEGDQGQVNNVYFVEEFGLNQDKQILQGKQEDIKNSSQKTWVFCNGSECSEMKPLSVKEWKYKRAEHFQECLRFFKTEIPQGRAICMFLLLSKDYEIMLEAADEICKKFPDQWFYVAESDGTAASWVEGLEQHNLGSEISNVGVVGMKWKHVSDTIEQMYSVPEVTSCELPTSYGAFCVVPEKLRNELVNLEILSANHCDSSEIARADTLREDHKKKVEKEFYHGSQVDWWNFWFKTHVLKRESYEIFKHSINSVLNGTLSNDDKVGAITLYHQPGAGGTTMARQVLWDLKRSYRCAVINKITDQTSDQISRLHLFDDIDNPNPVLLLCDNLEEERMFDLKAELEEKARLTCKQMDLVPQVFYVLLECKRRTDFPRSMIFGECHQLKHELHINEIQWFKDKFIELEENHKHKNGIDPKLLISFNLLKENFDPDYIKRTASEFISKIINLKEKRLLLYLSALNTYDMDFQAVPSSSFDPLMLEGTRGFIRTQWEKSRWETKISQSLKVLLNQTSRQDIGRVRALRIINSNLSSVILQTLIDQEGQSLAELLHEFLCSNIFYQGNDPMEKLLKIVRDIVKRRQRLYDGKYASNFSLLIEELIKVPKTGYSDAILVLTHVFELSDDVYVAQQISRLHIHFRNWIEAFKIANRSVNMKNDSSYLYDTLGCVFKKELGQMIESLEANSSNRRTITPNEAASGIEKALRGIEIFQKEQRISENEKVKSSSNNAGYFGELQMICLLLKWLSHIEGLHEPDILHKFLIEPYFVPRCCDALQNYVPYIKCMYDQVTSAMARLDDEYFQLKDITDDPLKGYGLQWNVRRLVDMKEVIESYFGENSNECPDNLPELEKCNYRSRRIFRLAGPSTYKGLLDASKRSDGLSTLTTIKQLAKQNISSLEDKATLYDLQYFIGATILLNTSTESHLRFQEGKDSITQLQELSVISKTLYDKVPQNHTLRTDAHIYLEPYLYVTLFNWPRSGFTPVIPTNQLQGILRNWTLRYGKKYTRQLDSKYKKKEHTMFYFGNLSGMQSIVSWNDLHNSDSKKKTNYALMSPQIKDKLARHEGFLKQDGQEIRLTFADKEYVDIPTGAFITNNALKKKQVSFVIGITWAGIRAYDVQLPIQHKIKPSQLQASRTNPKDRRPHLGSFPINIYYWQDDVLTIQRKLQETNTQLDRSSTKMTTRRRHHLQQQQKILQEQLFPYGQGQNTFTKMCGDY